MTFFLFILCVMWCIGTFIVMCFAPKELADTGVGRVAIGLIGFVLWVLIGLGPFALLKHETGPVEATLLKSEWQCSQSHQTHSIIYNKVGSVMIPQDISTTVCDVYTRR